MFSIFIIVCFVHRTFYFGDFSEKDLDNPKKRKQYWNISQKTVKAYKERLLLLRNKNYRLRKKVNTLVNLVDYLQNQKKISADCTKILKVS